MKSSKLFKNGKLKVKAAGLVLLCGVFLFSSFRQSCPRTLPFMDVKLPEAQSLAKKHNRILFIFICGTHCLKSHKMINECFTDTNIMRLYSNAFVCIKMNPDEVVNNYKLTNRGMTETPSFMFYSPNRQLLYRSNGFKSRKKLLYMAEIALRKMERMKSTEAKLNTMNCDGTIRNK